MKPCKCHWCGQRPTIRLERTWLGLVGVAECKPTCIAPSISVRADTPDEALEAVRRLWDKNNEFEEVTA